MRHKLFYSLVHPRFHVNRNNFATTYYGPLTRPLWNTIKALQVKQTREAQPKYHATHLSELPVPHNNDPSTAIAKTKITTRKKSTTKQLPRMLLFCPSCSNMLVISQIPSSHTAPEDSMNIGKNRFECRTCPYQMILDRRYFERKTMKLKDVGDILGGADSWKNVDQTEGKKTCVFLPFPQIWCANCLQ